ncbi:MAG: hypothetical protein HWE23_13520 [Rhodobacteraceae bacterium]|nr:hypothetical protein [Paracoccaceae bacterium]
MAGRAQAPLDDIMMAMDVVDTLRHEQKMVEKELGSEARDENMIERLRQVYASQGIHVPDYILEAGVEDLKRDRFVYRSNASGFQRFLALVYVTRSTWSKLVVGITTALVVIIVAWQFLVVAPRERAAEALRVELTEGIPARLNELNNRISGLTSDTSVMLEAQRLLEDGLTAASDKNVASARKASTDLENLAKNLAAAFEVKIVSREGVPTGVTRIPDANSKAKNYYIVVEAVDPDGRVIERQVISEENGEATTVTIWAQRVSRSIFERVRKDKGDDGIVQDAVLGTKYRGEKAIDWENGVQKGAITKW